MLPRNRNAKAQRKCLRHLKESPSSCKVPSSYLKVSKFQETHFQHKPLFIDVYLVLTDRARFFPPLIPRLSPDLEPLSSTCHCCYSHLILPNQHLPPSKPFSCPPPNLTPPYTHLGVSGACFDSKTCCVSSSSIILIVSQTLNSTFLTFSKTNILSA